MLTHPISNNEKADQNRIMDDFLLCQGTCVQECESKAPDYLQPHWSYQVAETKQHLLSL